MVSSINMFDLAKWKEVVHTLVYNYLAVIELTASASMDVVGLISKVQLRRNILIELADKHSRYLFANKYSLLDTGNKCMPLQTGKPNWANAKLPIAKYKMNLADAICER